MAKGLNKIAKMVRLAKQNEVAENFLSDLNYTIMKENESDYVPTKSYKPSGISGCKRKLYYEQIGTKPDGKADSINLVGICESGTDRHEIIQDYVQNMRKYGIECEWVDVGHYLLSNKIYDPEVIKKQGNETKLFSNKYNMRFMCDGLIKYKGEYYIIEIKTESTMKYSKHDDAYPEHKQQATCYAMTIGVPRVIFIYENRDNCDKKAFLVNITDNNIKYVEGIINYVNECVKTSKLPDRESDKCQYCNYKNKCRGDY